MAQAERNPADLFDDSVCRRFAVFLLVFRGNWLAFLALLPLAEARLMVLTQRLPSAAIE